MSTTYHPYKIALTDGQKKKLQKAYVTKTAVNLKVKPDQIGRGDELLLTATQISRLKKKISGRQRNGNKIKPATDSKYCAAWWKFVFNYARSGKTFDKTSSWGIHRTKWQI